MGGRAGSDYSSGEEEDAEWKSAIQSVVSSVTFGPTTASATTNNPICNYEFRDEDCAQNSRKFNHYQLKVQNLLDQMLEKRLVMVTNDVHLQQSGPVAKEGVIRLFKTSPMGIALRITEQQCPRKRARILPRRLTYPNSNKFRREIQSMAVDGCHIVAAARDAADKAAARSDAREASKRLRVKEEEERVAKLRTLRGERWLPSLLNAKFCCNS